MEDNFQEILTNPILDIAARFWEEERYSAFKTCYRSMRIIDDLVDDRKSQGHVITVPEKREYAARLKEWLTALERGKPSEPFTEELIEVRMRFLIPLWPWQRLIRSMIYDLDHNGFQSFFTFIRYSEGAAIAPASIFLHLCGVTKEDGAYLPPLFDIRKAARPLALFAYIVHIIRDFQKDQENNLNCLADNLVEKNGLDGKMLRKIAGGGTVPAGFRRLIGEYRDFADYYRGKARLTIDRVDDQLEYRYRLSLELIYCLYLQIFERIDPKRCGFTTAELSPSDKEVREVIDRTVTSFEKR